uniref:Vitamin K epoxide reductase domain-containing protein n=1 Tax=Sexangularia sp. CB-2014 TaxID=1486929 RepID=A0A7S1VD16_9EUKA|mmetsp:Transcript_16520/g.51693  ORF Transcript_16520/g.51693 Transcript_16520/m.51693 type:complete len:343 (+) Transcript_16520:21-1049(+)
MRPGVARLTIWACAIYSLVAMLYLYHEHTQLTANPAHAAFCDVSHVISCSTVLTSSYANVGPISLATAGIIFYTLLVYLATVNLLEPANGSAPLATFTTLAVGTAAILYAIAAELSLGAICIGCTSVHLAHLVALYASGRQFAWSVDRPGPGTPPSFLDGWRFAILQLRKGHLQLPPVRPQLAAVLVSVSVVSMLLLRAQVLAEASPAGTGAEFADGGQQVLAGPVGPGVAGSDEASATAPQAASRSWTADELVPCFLANNVRMHGARSCGSCHAQLALFAGVDDSPFFVECASPHNPRCGELGVRGFPTWIRFTDASLQDAAESSLGRKSLAELAVFAQCT